MEDIRLSDEVKNIWDKNQEYVEIKSRKLASQIKQLLEKEFEWKFDESFWFVLYTRKWNDVNTLVVNTLLWTGVSTWADRWLFRDALRWMADSIDNNETDLLDE